VNYVESEKKYERIFKKEVKVCHKEWLEYVEERKKFRDRAMKSGL